MDTKKLSLKLMAAWLSSYIVAGIIADRKSVV